VEAYSHSLLTSALDLKGKGCEGLDRFHLVWNRFQRLYLVKKGNEPHHKFQSVNYTSGCTKCEKFPDHQNYY